ncbi:ABC transporter ATP-binding protein [Streptomyces spiroverticillatus]|uniref:ABC transporter ATP-binding protein n=1 Tax=Streptomyces finlayi TaxID=67296 RepID=A0A918X1X3_9ACTN|nr:ABC transporter ATP-binding protein [Streptomyces spiroverticillatus]GHD04628.1 ABC transporter ATP-binding protein [Streptomyces finlayi]
MSGHRPSRTRLRADGRRFLARHRGALACLTGWSLAESAQTFLGGYCVAQSLDRGFLAGHAGTGLIWLGVAALAILAGGPVTRGVFTQLAALVEPFRDGLVRRAVAQALHAATCPTDPGPGPSAPGTAVSRLTQQTEIARDSFAGLVLTARSFVFTAVGAFGGMFALAPELLLVTLPPLALGLGVFLGVLGPMARAQRRALDAEEAYADRVRAAAAGLRDVAACGIADEVGAAADASADTAARAARVLARWAAVRTVALGVAGQLPPLLLLLATPWLLDRGVGAGALTGALTYLVQSLLPALHTLMTALGAAGTRLLVVLDRFARPPDPPPPARSTPPAAGPAPAAELRHVTLAYGPGARPVLDDLSLTLAPGEHLAVVGPSGIGKSTLANVLAGLLTPDEGVVRIAGRSGCGPALRTLVPQEAYVFTATLRENLTHLRPEATPAEVAAAVDALGLGPLAARLGGLDAEVDPAHLSQGERQLVTLARAHLSPAPLLLLDEATCHLDPEAEERAERTLAARPGALVVVAHRTASALRADRILVLDGTRADCGTHDELLERSALYRDLMGRQPWTPVSHPAGRTRDADRVDPVARAGLADGRREVVPYRSPGQVQVERDLGDARALRGEREHAQFPRGEGNLRGAQEPDGE